jgi:hypothetical protein
LQLLVNGYSRTPCSSDHDECADQEQKDVESEEQLEAHTLQARASPVVPKPHGSLELHGEECAQKRTDKADKIVKEWDRLGNDEGNEPGEEDAGTDVSDDRRVNLQPHDSVLDGIL